MATGVVLCAAGLAACGSSPVRVEPPRTSAPECAALLDALPEKVDGHESRAVEPSGAAAAAWGDPAIVVRCGVPRPPRLKPSSRCAEVNGVGWFAQERDSGYRFTTIGRAVYVEVFVPYDYEPAADALVDLASAIKGAVPEEQPCV